MKIIFLDFDGVLNSAVHFQALKAKGYSTKRIMDSLEPGMIERLNKIVEATGAHIVVSSTWRKYHSIEGLKNFLVKYGFQHADTVIDITPTLNTDRGIEIQKWMDDYKARLNYESDPISHFVILDDNGDMVHAHLLSKLVLTTWEDGMKDEHAAKAIEILGA